VRSWSIDIDMDPSWLMRGPYAVSGTQGAFGLTFAARYDWN
jgi:hypothetical protein